MMKKIYDICLLWIYFDDACKHDRSLRVVHFSNENFSEVKSKLHLSEQ